MWEKSSIRLLCTFGIYTLVNGCVDPYDPRDSPIALKALVVDAFINLTNQTCSITLRRSVPLTYKLSPPLEHKASIVLEFNDGKSIPVSETQPGSYFTSSPDLQSGKRVRLKIKTLDGNEFESDQVTLLDSPPIDSVSFGAGRTGVPIYVSTHDPTGNAQYFLWRYIETWRYSSAFFTTFGLDEDGFGNAIVIPLVEPYYYCWKTENSTDILIASAAPTDKDINKISNRMLSVIPWTSPKFVDRYSIEVEQRSISKEAFDYLLELKQNTEDLGTLFDPMPSHPLGNMRCLSNAEIRVLGFFTGSAVHTKRIFIDYFDIKRPPGTRPVTGYENCREVDFVNWDQYSYLLPATGSRLAEPFCVDCRRNGGTNKMPSFWTYTDPED